MTTLQIDKFIDNFIDNKKLMNQKIENKIYLYTLLLLK